MGGLPEDLQFELIEPLRELFKVRGGRLELCLRRLVHVTQPLPRPAHVHHCIQCSALTLGVCTTPLALRTG